MSNPNIENYEELVKMMKRVFSTPDGQDLLKWMERETAYRLPDFENPHVVYFNQGQLHLVQKIKGLINDERKKSCLMKFNP